MNLDRYVAQCGELASELIDSLSLPDQQALREQLNATDLETWLAWRAKHAESVRAFVAASPSQRARKKSWQPARLLLTLAATQQCLEAELLLQAIQHLVPGNSYRDMAVMAGQAYNEVLCGSIDLWPFDEVEPPAMFLLD